VEVVVVEGLVPEPEEPAPDWVPVGSEGPAPGWVAAAADWPVVD
jgi:hypothetical protein